MQHSVSTYIVQSLQQTRFEHCILIKKTLIHYFKYATVNSNNVLSSHWLVFMRWPCSGNQFSERVQINLFWGGTNFRGIQIKHDISWFILSIYGPSKFCLSVVYNAISSWPLHFLYRMDSDCITIWVKDGKLRRTTNFKTILMWVASLL